MTIIGRDIKASLLDPPVPTTPKVVARLGMAHLGMASFRRLKLNPTWGVVPGGGDLKDVAPALLLQLQRAVAVDWLRQ